jgi:sugar lactone lactonase YvrE
MKILKFSRTTSLVIALIMIFQIGNVSIAAKTAQYHWTTKYINELAQNQKLIDYLSTSKILNNLDKPIAKGDFIALLTGLVDINGLQLDIEDNSGLGSDISREDAVTIAGKLCRLESHNEVVFSDKENISQDAYIYISAFAEQGIIVGDSYRRFQPKNNLTGAEAIAIISKLVKQGYISSNNVIDFAGNINGYKDGAALQANFFRPTGLCSDGKGRIIVIDTYNNLIRRVSEQKVETIAGKQLNRVDEYKVPIGGYVNARITEALFNKPQFCTTNIAGDVLVSDTGNNSIRLISNSRVTSLNSSITAGYKDGKLKAALFNKPSDIVCDKLGNVYVADTLNNCIRYIDMKNGKVSTFVGKQSTPGLKDGPIREALFNQPVGLAIDSNGALYVSDSGNQRIRKISKGMVSTLAGSGNSLLEGTGNIEGGYADGEKSQAKFNFPSGIDVNTDGIVFVADTGNHRIRAITKTKVITIAGNGEAAYIASMARAASFNEPSDVLVNGSKLYISDTFNSKIRGLNIDTKWIRD